MTRLSLYRERNVLHAMEQEHERMGRELELKDEEEAELRGFVAFFVTPHCGKTKAEDRRTKCPTTISSKLLVATLHLLIACIHIESKEPVVASNSAHKHNYA